MKKIILIIITVLFLVSCGQFLDSPGFEDPEIYKISYDAVDLFFDYPKGALIAEKNGQGELYYNSCRIKFASSDSESYEKFLFVKDDSWVSNMKNENGIEFKAWIFDSKLVAYEAKKVDFNYVFWIYDNGDDVSDCTDILDKMINSFTDKSVYQNDKFSFSVKILADYKIEYLLNGNGVLMKKWIDKEQLEKEGIDKKALRRLNMPNIEGYKIELIAKAYANVEGYKDLADMINQKYSGFTTEFGTYNNINGVFIDEGADGVALRHFFVFSEDSKNIYELTLEVPRAFFSRNKDVFEELLSSFLLF